MKKLSLYVLLVFIVELFDWFKIDQAEFDKKSVRASELEEQLVK